MLHWLQDLTIKIGTTAPTPTTLTKSIHFQKYIMLYYYAIEDSLFSVAWVNDKVILLQYFLGSYSARVFLHCLHTTYKCLEDMSSRSFYIIRLKQIKLFFFLVIWFGPRGYFNCLSTVAMILSLVSLVKWWPCGDSI